MILNSKQTATIHDILRFIINPNKLCGNTYIVSGGAGTGKSLLLSKLYNTLTNVGYKVSVIAPTGKAVFNLTSKNPQLHATTIHALMFEAQVLIRNVRDKTGQYVFDVDGKHITEQYFKFNKRSPDDIRAICDVIALDEASMLTSDINDSLIELDIPIIMFGDHNQLPPIPHKDDENKDFNIMKTPIDSLLTEVQRTTMDNAIFKLAYSVLYTGRINIFDYGKEVSFLSHSEFNYNFIRNNQIDTVIVNSNRERVDVNNDFRQSLYGLNRGDLPIAGEKVTCLHNNVYLGKEITAKNKTSVNKFNGQIELLDKDCVQEIEGSPKMTLELGGIKVPIEIDKFYENKKYADMERIKFAFGYALTVHKSQGSEFDNVVIIMPSAFVMDNYMDDVKAWIYTAITRAKKKLWIVGAS